MSVQDSVDFQKRRNLNVRDFADFHNSQKRCKYLHHFFVISMKLREQVFSLSIFYKVHFIIAKAGCWQCWLKYFKGIEEMVQNGKFWSNSRQILRENVIMDRISMTKFK